MFAFLLVANLGACSRNPLGTQLPLKLADIPLVQSQLDKLPSDERALVLAYLARSKDDVLPAKFADPDSPFTARTFAEAIKLQREFNVRQSAENLKAAEYQEARDDALEPLRKAVSIELMNREILTADQVSGREPSSGQAINGQATLVTTYRLVNRSGNAISKLSGSVTIRTESDPQSLMGAARCYIDYWQPIPVGESVEIRCGNANQGAGSADKEFVALPQSALILTWEPKSITYGDGRVLSSGS